MRHLSLVLILGIMATACATARSISPLVFQGPEFDQIKYQIDLANCSRLVDDQASGLASGADVTATTVGGAALGAIAGALLGGAIGHAGRGAMVGTAIGGTAGGIGAYEGTERETQKVYHQAVTSCLTLKGYQVMGATGQN